MADLKELFLTVEVKLDIIIKAIPRHTCTHTHTQKKSYYQSIEGHISFTYSHTLHNDILFNNRPHTYGGPIGLVPYSLGV